MDDIDGCVQEVIMMVDNTGMHVDVAEGIHSDYFVEFIECLIAEDGGIRPGHSGRTPCIIAHHLSYPTLPHLGVEDLLVLLAAYGTQSEVANIAGNHNPPLVNVEDLLALFAGFGYPCAPTQHDVNALVKLASATVQLDATHLKQFDDLLIKAGDSIWLRDDARPTPIAAELPLPRENWSYKALSAEQRSGVQAVPQLGARCPVIGMVWDGVECVPEATTLYGRQKPLTAPHYRDLPPPGRRDWKQTMAPEPANKAEQHEGKRQSNRPTPVPAAIAPHVLAFWSKELPSL